MCNPAHREDPRRALGRRGEDLAVAHLIRAGYDILDRNFCCARGELDVVAERGDALVFCEVKTRVAGGRVGPAHPLEAIGAVKQTRLRRLAAEWLRTHGPQRHASTFRFDAIGIILEPSGRLVALEHVEAAF